MQTPSRPRALLFDLDDTIISYDAVSGPAWRNACQTCAAESGTSPETLYGAIREYSRWFWSDPERHRTGRLDMINTRHRIVEEAFAKLRIDNIPLAHRLADLYTDQREGSVAFFDGSESTLVSARATGLPMVLVTNGEQRTQRAKVNRFGLERFFDAILIEGETGVGKPDMRVYHMALERAGCSGSDAWFVGDNLEWDIQKPQALGMFTVWNDWRNAGLPANAPARPSMIITAIAQLRPIFEQWPSIADGHRP